MAGKDSDIDKPGMAPKIPKARLKGLSTGKSFARNSDSSPGKLGKSSRLSEALSSLRRKGAIKG